MRARGKPDDYFLRGFFFFERLFVPAFTTGFSTDVSKMPGGGPQMNPKHLLGPENAIHSLIVCESDMLRLHLAHIGRRFPISRVPPLLSGTLCPTWKSKHVIVFLHHGIQH